jgi:hypothetical protein
MSEMKNLTIWHKLSIVQNEVKVLKNQRNTFGNYNFRSAEDIMEASKPICQKWDCFIITSDELVLVGDRYYVEATATLYDFEGNSISAKSQARESETKKGMDVAQITGASSSYARKYALGGLLQLDDNKDPDATNKHGKDKTDQPDKYDKSPVGTGYAKSTLIQRDIINDYGKRGVLDLEKVKAYYKVDSIESLSHEQAEAVIDKGEKNENN